MRQNKIIEHKILLENHPLLVTNIIQNLDDLKLFMEHHVFAVWDFMSLAKALQHRICPSGDLWLPSKRQRKLSRFINEIILAEESDLDPFNSSYISHFDLYCQTMAEIGADTGPIMKFLESVEKNGIDFALLDCFIPDPSREFMTATFEIIKRGQAHEIAAAFTYGRETIIPEMFRRLVNQLDINSLDASRFLFYLERHIEVDGDDHGPAALELMSELCENHPLKIIEAEHTAIKAIQARIQFWDQVEERILGNTHYV
jgi:Protein of unknown function (DUF3050)